MANTPTPKEIKLHQKSKLLEIQFDDDTITVNKKNLVYLHITPFLVFK